MATALTKAWTASSLIPTIAAGFSPGAAWSPQAPAQVSANPNALIESRNQLTRASLLSKILGQTKPTGEAMKEPAKQPNQNTAVNSFSTSGFSYQGNPTLNLMR